MLEDARADPNGDAAESLALLQEAVELTMEPVASGGSRLDLKKSLNSLLEARHGPVLSESLGAALAASAGQKNDFSEAAQIDVLKDILGPAAVRRRRSRRCCSPCCWRRDAPTRTRRPPPPHCPAASSALPARRAVPRTDGFAEAQARYRRAGGAGGDARRATTFHDGRPPPDEAEALALLKQVIEEADGRHREGAAAAAVLVAPAAVEAFSGVPGEANAEKER